MGWNKVGVKSNIAYKSYNSISVLKKSKLAFLEIKKFKSNLTFSVSLSLRPNHCSYKHFLCSDSSVALELNNIYKNERTFCLK